MFTTRRSRPTARSSSPMSRGTSVSAARPPLASGPSGARQRCVAPYFSREHARHRDGRCRQMEGARSAIRRASTRTSGSCPAVRMTVRRWRSIAATRRTWCGPRSSIRTRRRKPLSTRSTKDGRVFEPRVRLSNDTQDDAAHPQIAVDSAGNVGASGTSRMATRGASSCGLRAAGSSRFGPLRHAEQRRVGLSSGHRRAARRVCGRVASQDGRAARRSSSSACHYEPLR